MKLTNERQVTIHNIAFETGYTELAVLVKLLEASGEEVEL